MPLPALQLPDGGLSLEACPEPCLGNRGSYGKCAGGEQQRANGVQL